MIKRVTIVLSLLFANIAFGQTTDAPLLATTTVVNDTPVVAVEAAIGSTTNISEVVASTTLLDFPAESQIEIEQASTTEIVESELGAFGTSSTSTASTTIVETEEGTLTQPTDEEKLFDLVYGGFQEFVRVFLGWE